VQNVAQCALLGIQDLEGLFCKKGLLGCRMCPRGALHGIKDLEGFSVMHQAGLALTSKQPNSTI
jgi:hypothetical protein